MQAYIVVVIAMSFAAVFLGLYGIVLWWQKRRLDAEERLYRRLGLRTAAEADPASSKAEEDAVASIIREQAADAATGFLGEYGEQLEILVRASGQDITVTSLLQRAGLFAVVGMVGGFMAAGVMGLGGGLIGYLPVYLLQSAAKKRASDLTTQLPDALELMSRAMQTGTGLSEAFKLASEEMPQPCATEFGRIYEEVRFGKEWRETLTGLLDRNPTIFELRLLVSSMLLQRETGGNMIETLSAIARTIRQRYVFDAKVKAMTSEARASGFILAAMPLGVIGLILVANAEYLSPLVTKSMGQATVMVCILIYVFGLYLMNAATRVDG